MFIKSSLSVTSPGNESKSTINWLKNNEVKFSIEIAKIILLIKQYCNNKTIKIFIHRKRVRENIPKKNDITKFYQDIVSELRQLGNNPKFAWVL